MDIQLKETLDSEVARIYASRKEGAASTELENVFLALVGILRAQQGILDALTGVRRSAASLTDTWAGRWIDRA